MTERLRELLAAARREAWDPWDWASWAPTEDPAAPFVRLVVNVPIYNADFLVRADPDTIRELLNAHDRMAGALRGLLDAIDRESLSFEDASIRRTAATIEAARAALATGEGGR